MLDRRDIDGRELRFGLGLGFVPSNRCRMLLFTLGRALLVVVGQLSGRISVLAVLVVVCVVLFVSAGARILNFDRDWYIVVR